MTLLTSKCASCVNGVQSFISHLASWLRSRRFSEPTLRPFGCTNQWKTHNVSRVFYFFRAPASSLFWLSPFLVFSISHLLPSGFLHAGAFSWLLFCICPYCRKSSFQTSFDYEGVSLNILRNLNHHVPGLTNNVFVSLSVVIKNDPIRSIIYKILIYIYIYKCI